MTVTIPYHPRKYFEAFHNSGKRWSIIIAHRRCGKTTAAINHLIREAVRVPKSVYAFISPTYVMSKRTAFGIMKHHAAPIPGMVFNESELKATFPNGSIIYLLGADNPDSLRGMALWGVVFDEFSQQPSNIFTEIIRPALSDHLGFGIWIGTPKGHNVFFDLYNKHRNDPDWYCSVLRASETNALKPEELDAAKKLMSDEEYEQEYECSFTAALKGAYYGDLINEAKKGGRIRQVDYDKMIPVQTFWDLGMDDATAIIFAQFTPTDCRIIDYYESSGEALDHYATVVKAKPYQYIAHHLPHDVEVREMTTGKSRLEALQALFREPIVVCPKLPINDGIQATRRRLATCWFDEVKTMRLVNALEQYHKEWDADRGIFKSKPLHDWTSHAADAMRYLSVSEPAKSMSKTHDMMRVRQVHTNRKLNQYG